MWPLQETPQNGSAGDTGEGQDPNEETQADNTKSDSRKDQNNSLVTEPAVQFDRVYYNRLSITNSKTRSEGCYNGLARL